MVHELIGELIGTHGFDTQMVLPYGRIHPSQKPGVAIGRGPHEHDERQWDESRYGVYPHVGGSECHRLATHLRLNPTRGHKRDERDHGQRETEGRCRETDHFTEQGRSHVASQEQRLDPRISLGEAQDADHRAADEGHGVDASHRGGAQAGTRTEATDDEPRTHDESAHQGRPQIGRIHVNRIQIQDAEVSEDQHAGHRGDAGREKNLQHGEIIPVKESDQFAGRRESGLFEHEAEPDTEQKRHHEIELRTDHGRD